MAGGSGTSQHSSIGDRWFANPTRWGGQVSGSGITSHLLMCCSMLEAHAVAGRLNSGRTRPARSGGRCSLLRSRSIPSLSRTSGTHMLPPATAASAAPSSAGCQRSPAGWLTSEQLMASVGSDASGVFIVGGGGRGADDAPSVSAMSNSVGVDVARAAAGATVAAGRCAVRGPPAAAPLGHAPAERHHLNRTAGGGSS